jgi:protein-tyrosine phosphatase
MAAEYARHRAAREGLGRVAVDSAGLLGIEGAPASPEAIRVLRDEGLDLFPHRSRGLDAADVRSADLVLVMTPEHLRQIRVRFPGIEPDILLRRAFEEGPEPREDPPPLDDPMGAGEADYRECFETIRRCVDHLVVHLRHAPP